MEFQDPETLDATRTRLKELRLRFRGPDSNKFAWLDARKSEQELKPSRLIGRMFQLLGEIEGLRADSSLTTCLKGKHISAKSMGMLGFVSRSNSTWTWATNARNRYETANLEEGQGYAASV
jgi:hypothetical protein